ncbi:hypothetical protein CAE39_000159 [Salmonella enterica subsp. enterica serovar Edinburgh]|nr:hypothetical protein [Salmonella enterica subsp. enterica serovar Edinburgh]EEJ3242130.1 hypothetical protein [Salmonella enterica]
MPLIFILKTCNAFHKTAGAIQQALIPFYYIKLITILQSLFLIQNNRLLRKGYRFL